jgi:rfaE bifunctional protein kinase chain/domain/rfaE bifunctional protein nucleotidyltransferase chain/domain
MNSTKNKIFSLEQLKNKIFLEKKRKKTVVHCHGVFDVLHYGHIKHFKSAKKNGDFLIVSITSDEFVNKGKGRPIFSSLIRAEVLSSISSIDAVFINRDKTPINLIKQIKPNIYFKGPDYKKMANDNTKNIIKEKQAVEKYGGLIKFSNDETFSSSKIINNHLNILNGKQKLFIQNISKKYGFKKIKEYVDRLKKLNILLLGETIIDEYYFGDVLGKSGKEPHLVMSQKDKEIYLGGSAAVANHLSSFCKKVNFLTYIGKDKDSKNFIKKNLKKNIVPNFILKKNGSTIIKKRYIDIVSKNKLLGVYKLNDTSLDKTNELLLFKQIIKLMRKSDLILVTDYDHGMISAKNAKFISNKKNFFCLNAQVNASNLGYHSLRKYNNIDVLVINENELRHELRDRVSEIKILGLRLLKELKIKILVVTRGDNGAILLNKKSSAIECPAFASKIIDKVGAGDSMLAIISMCLKAQIPDDLSLLLGSLAGADSVENIGNSSFINKNKLMRQLEFLIK